MFACRADGRAPVAVICSVVRGRDQGGPAAGDGCVPACGEAAGDDQHQVGVGYRAGGLAASGPPGEGEGDTDDGAARVLGRCGRIPDDGCFDAAFVEEGQ